MKHDLYVGKRVLWQFRVGYGFVLRVPVRIVAVTGNRVTIAIESTGVHRLVSLRSIIDPPTMRGVKPEVLVLPVVSESPEVAEKSPAQECSICRGRHGREVTHVCE